MVKVCCVKNCNNRSTRESDRRYFSIPGSSTQALVDDDNGRVTCLTALRRAKWIDAIRGPNVDDMWEATGAHKVCSDHFLSGEPAELKDENSVDWVPTVKMGHAEVGREPEEIEDADNRWRNWENFVRRIMVFIKSGSHEEDLTKAEQRAILKAAKTYYLEGGVLYHQRSGKPLRVVMLEAEHKAVIRQCHVFDSGVHSGINATMDRITSKFFWRGIKQDVVHYISHCCGIQRSDRPRDFSKAVASKSQDDDCSSASGEESSKVKGSIVSSDIMTASSAIKKIANTISKQKSSTALARTRSHEDSENQHPSENESAFENDKPVTEESKEGSAESERQEAEEVMILDENEGMFVKVNRKLIEAESVSDVCLNSADDTKTEENTATQTLVIKNEGREPGLAKDPVSDSLSASATILKLVNNATKEKGESRSFKNRGLNTWPKQKPHQRAGILPKLSPIPAITPSVKSPVKADADGKATTKIYRSVAWSLYNIGLKMVRQQVYRELVEIQELKDEQKRLDESEKRQLEKLRGYYMDLRQKNRYLMTPGRRCRCGYRFASRQELELHQEYGHGWDNGRYDCCLCKFTSKAFALFSSHMLREHGRKARFQQLLAAFVCPYCTFEHRHNTKKKLLRHIANCERNFQLDYNLAVRAVDSDIPILAPPKPVVSSTASEVDGTAARVTSISKLQASKNQRSLLKALTAEGNGQTASANAGGNLPLKAVQQSALAKTVSYEICEICGGFTKDRMSLFIHLQVAHKVDLYPSCAKMSELPIACNSCSERFWTPVGLDRHVLLQHSQNIPDPIAKALISVCPLCKRTRLTDVMLHLAQQHRVTLLDMFSVCYCALCLVELHSEKAFEDHMISRHTGLYPCRSVLLDSIRKLDQARPASSRPASAILLALVSRNKYKYGPSRAPLHMYSCPICRCHYGSLDELTSHFERAHPLKCCRCEFRCKSAEVLWKHFRVEHEDVDTCPICQEEVPSGRGTIEHFEKRHLQRCTVSLDPISDIGELRVKGQHAEYTLGNRRRPSSLSDGSAADSLPGDEATPPKSPKLENPDDDVNDLDSLEIC